MKRKKKYKKTGAPALARLVPPNPLEGGFSALANVLLSGASSNVITEIATAIDWNEHRLALSVVAFVATKGLSLAVRRWSQWRSERLRSDE